MKIYHEKDMDANPQAGLHESDHDQEPLTETGSDNSESHAPSHTKDEANMNASTPDRDSRAALLALNSYIPKDDSHDNRSE